MGVCSFKAVIPAPLVKAWEFIIGQETLHRWGSQTQPGTGSDRPLATGDQGTPLRQDFFRHYRQVLRAVASK